MASVAVKVEGTGREQNIRNFDVASGVAVAKHTVMVIAGDYTASSSTTTSSGALFAGVAIADKDSTDASTTLALDTGGVWDLTASDSITAGHKVCLANGANMVGDGINYSATTLAQQGIVVGVALKTATNGTTVPVDISRK